jgi:hypothetical protein
MQVLARRKFRRDGLWNLPEGWACRACRAFLALCLIFTWPGEASPGTQPTEYGDKAIFITRFASLVEWPAAAFPNANSPVVFCVFGDYRFGISLAEAAKGSMLHGRKTELRWIRDKKELHQCHVLFMSRSEEKRYAALLADLKSESILTIGESPAFLDAGGMVHVYPGESVLWFEINLAAAEEAHLKLNSRLLTLAHGIRDRAKAKSS